MIIFRFNQKANVVTVEVNSQKNNGLSNKKNVKLVVLIIG
jgi:hypothetical protein